MSIDETGIYNPEAEQQFLQDFAPAIHTPDYEDILRLIPEAEMPITLSSFLNRYGDHMATSYDALSFLDSEVLIKHGVHWRYQSESLDWAVVAISEHHQAHPLDTIKRAAALAQHRVDLIYIKLEENKIGQKDEKVTPEEAEEHADSCIEHQTQDDPTKLWKDIAQLADLMFPISVKNLRLVLQSS